MCTPLFSRLHVWYRGRVGHTCEQQVAYYLRTHDKKALFGRWEGQTFQTFRRKQPGKYSREGSLMKKSGKGQTEKPKCDRPPHFGAKKRYDG